MNKSNKVPKQIFTFPSRKLTSLLIIFIFFAIFTFKTTEGRAISKFSLHPNFPLGQYQIEEWLLRGAATSLGHRLRLTGGDGRGGMGGGGRGGVGVGGGVKRGEHSLLLNPLPLQRECYFELSLDYSVYLEEDYQNERTNEEGGGEGREGGEGGGEGGGGGFAIWLINKVAEFGHSFGGPQRWEGIAITFDSEREMIEVHRSDGRKTMGEETYEGGCHFPFKRSSYEFSSFYLLLEHDLLHIFVTNEGEEGGGGGGGEWKECVLKHQIQFLDQFYVSISASSSSLSLKQDIKKLSITIAEELSIDEESFNRPPLQTIAPLITHRLDDFVNAIIEGSEDDEDLAIEVEELNDWFDSQFESLKVTIGGQIVEINFGLDQLLSSSSDLSKQIEIIKEMNEELEKQFENVEKSSEDFLNNNKNVNYEPLYILQSDLNLLFESSANISNSINVIQQSQNKHRLKNKDNKSKILKAIEEYLLYAVTGIISFSVVLFIYKKLTSTLKSNLKSKSKFAPHWAA